MHVQVWDLFDETILLTDGYVSRLPCCRQSSHCRQLLGLACGLLTISGFCLPLDC